MARRADIALNGKEGKTLSMILHFLRDESGATAIEYGLICALIILAAVGAMTTFATNVIAMYATVVAAVSG